MELASRPTITSGNRSKPEALVSADWLVSHLNDPNVRIVEVDVSEAAYEEMHIDGAILWNVYTDLRDAAYQPVGLQALEALLGRSGIEETSTVVFYGYASTLGYWLAKLLGQARAHVLDCSREAWRIEGRPWSKGFTSTRPVERSIAERQPHLRAAYEDVRRSIEDASVTLLDVRAPTEYLGERFWPSGGIEPNGRAGHVPSAINQPLDDLYDARGRFLPVEVLCRRFPGIDLDSHQEVIIYCTIGGRAATAWFVLTELLGRPSVRVYEGSWAEWGFRPDAPIEL